MSLLESTRIASRSLRASPLRSLLTILGIVIGVAAVMTMVAIGAGARAQVAEQIRALGANLLIIEPGGPRSHDQAGDGHALTEADARAVVGEVPFVEAAAPVVWGTNQAVYGNRNWTGLVIGTVPGYFIARDWEIVRGRAFTERELSTSAKFAVIGAGLVEALFDGADPIGQIIRIDNVPVTIVGVLARKGPKADGRDQDNRIFLPITTAKMRLFGGAQEVNREAVAYIWVKTRSPSAMAPVQAQIRTLLRQRHRLIRSAKDDFWVRDAAAALAAQREATRTMTILLAAVASVSLVVGGISIMNIMLVSVTERTREIGLRLAVGARRRDILTQFLIESVTLCSLGGVFGFLLGVVAAVGVARFADWPVIVGLEATALAVGFTATVGVFFGFYPALRASQLDPIEALRFE